jgi:hypothetical protein
MVFAMVLPAVGTARRSAAKTSCQTHIRHISDAALNHSRNNRDRIVADLRWPAWRVDAAGARYPRTATWNNNPPWQPEMRELSWLGQLQGYLGDDRQRLDCPLVNDHRKGGYNAETDRHVWDTDYSINRFALNTTTDAADEPSRAVLFGEPNMPRATISYLPEVIAWRQWWMNQAGERTDLEQVVADSVSFSFADGHAVRVIVPDVEHPFLAAYPELALSAGSPPTGSHVAMFSNYFWWHREQVVNPLIKPQPNYPAPNDRITR